MRATSLVDFAACVAAFNAAQQPEKMSRADIRDLRKELGWDG